EPVLSSLGGLTIDVTASVNNNATRDGNVRQRSTSFSYIAASNEGIVTDSPTNPNKSGSGFSRPTSYAKLVTGEPSSESVNFRTLLAPTRNGVDIAISLESV
nr:hypothetical protein [Tanacetum cinerariifolium]